MWQSCVLQGVQTGVTRAIHRARGCDNSTSVPIASHHPPNSSSMGTDVLSSASSASTPPIRPDRHTRYRLLLQPYERTGCEAVATSSAPCTRGTGRASCRWCANARWPCRPSGARWAATAASSASEATAATPRYRSNKRSKYPKCRRWPPPQTPPPRPLPWGLRRRSRCCPPCRPRPRPTSPATGPTPPRGRPIPCLRSRSRSRAAPRPRRPPTRAPPPNPSACRPWSASLCSRSTIASGRTRCSDCCRARPTISARSICSSWCAKCWTKICSRRSTGRGTPSSSRT